MGAFGARVADELALRGFAADEPHVAGMVFVVGELSAPAGALALAVNAVAKRGCAAIAVVVLEARPATEQLVALAGLLDSEFASLLFVDAAKLSEPNDVAQRLAWLNDWLTVSDRHCPVGGDYREALRTALGAGTVAAFSEVAIDGFDSESMLVAFVEAARGGDWLAPSTTDELLSVVTVVRADQELAATPVGLFDTYRDHVQRLTRCARHDMAVVREGPARMQVLVSGLELPQRLVAMAPARQVEAPGDVAPTEAIAGLAAVVVHEPAGAEAAAAVGAAEVAAEAAAAEAAAAEVTAEVTAEVASAEAIAAATLLPLTTCAGVQAAVDVSARHPSSVPPPMAAPLSTTACLPEPVVVPIARPVAKGGMHKGIRVLLMAAGYFAFSFVAYQLFGPPELDGATIAGALVPRVVGDQEAPAVEIGATDRSLLAKALQLPSERAVAPVPDDWQRFLGRLRQLKAGQRDKIRVLHLGDSELAGDGTSGEMRRTLAERFGDGGPGFSLAMAARPWYVRDGFQHRPAGDFDALSYPFGQLSSGMYGPGGIAFDGVGGARARVSIDPIEGACTLSFFYGYLPSGGEVKLYVDGSHVATVVTHREQPGVGMHRQRLETCPRDVELRVAGGRTRVYGWGVENDRPGIVWSSLGVVAARLPHLSHYDAGHLVASLRSLEPDLVVMTFGLNLAAQENPPTADYAQQAEASLRRLRDGLGNVPCLVTGPYPVGHWVGGRYERDTHHVEQVARGQRKAAEAAGCAFIDRFALFGGAAAVQRWLNQRPRIISGDFLHLTAEGSRRMGRSLAGVILASFDADTDPSGELQRPTEL